MCFFLDWNPPSQIIHKEISKIFVHYTTIYSRIQLRNVLPFFCWKDCPDCCGQVSKKLRQYGWCSGAPWTLVPGYYSTIQSMYIVSVLSRVTGLWLGWLWLVCNLYNYSRLTRLHNYTTNIYTEQVPSSLENTTAIIISYEVSDCRTTQSTVYTSYTYQWTLYPASLPSR